MNILVTAGNTQTPIDEVRCITNIFSGRTGGRIALTAWERGHRITHLTSHPNVVAELSGVAPDSDRWELHAYRTYDDLRRLMETLIASRKFHVVIHAAAVGDYALEGVYAPAETTRFDRLTGSRHGSDLVDVSAGKVKSSYPELWLRLTPTPKLVDLIRAPWGFTGTLVKFKLEVGVSEDVLCAIAEKSRLQSRADLMVANTLEGKEDWALLGSGNYQRVRRDELAVRLLTLIESIQTGPSSDRDA